MMWLYEDDDNNHYFYDVDNDGNDDHASHDDDNDDHNNDEEDSGDGVIIWWWWKNWDHVMKPCIMRVEGDHSFGVKLRTFGKKGLAWDILETSNCGLGVNFGRG